jgi:hypothetical protein
MRYLLLSVVFICSTILACEADDDPNGGGDKNACDSCELWERCSENACVFNPASQWDLVVVDGVVSTHDSSGSTWDALGGLPDPFVCLTVNGITKCTVPRQDTTNPSWNSTLFHGVGAGSLIGGMYFELYDEDVTSDDTMCWGNSTVDEPSFYSGSFRIECSSINSHVNFRLDYSY